ncbi:hypothetical protein KI688_003034 [Linnemannia hyalina]|uniref:F-box domain-containing protein n=1 Tax=Linnemannia hyalina TaxID=64524 RepID=A0A9P7XP44_9FUNG|nr:hypothetical protein KI688_003034 [Linnemannia hyalina]
MHPLFPPELVREIANYLDTRDLLRALLVNKDWCSTWTPLLWADFTVVSSSLTRDIIGKKFQPVLARHGTHIRNVFVRHEPHIKVLQALCVAVPAPLLSLSSLCVSTRLDLETNVDRLIEILKRSPQLRNLDVTNTPVPGAWFERLLGVISPGLPRLKSLKLMHMHVHPKASPLALRTFLETCSSELETLVVKFGISCPLMLFMAPPPMTIPGTKSHPKLKVLQLEVGYPSMSGPMEPIFPWILNGFLEGCSGLEVVDDRFFPFEGRRQWFTDDMSILRTLHGVMGVAFRNCFWRQQHSGQVVASLEGTLSGELSDLNADDRGVQEVWQGINLGDYDSSTITEEDRKAITHAASQRGFQKLVINNKDWLSSEDLLVILRTCPTLRVLECGYDRYPSITATELTRQPWSSKWLKVLHLIISGIPRPDIKTDARDQPIPAGTPFHTGDMEESRVLQRKVCAQLGALVCLEDLCLGYSLARDMVAETDNEGSDDSDDNDGRAVKKYNPFLQLTCLELTLESGLDLLSELKSLEFFSIWGMDHRIGRKELYWMQRNWHSVRRVFGLLPLPYQGSMRHFGSDPSVLSCRVAFSIM